MDPDQARHFVGPDLGPYCLQGLSADETISTELTATVMPRQLVNSATHFLCMPTLKTQCAPFRAYIRVSS